MCIFQNIIQRNSNQGFSERFWKEKITKKKRKNNNILMNGSAEEETKGRLPGEDGATRI